MGVLERIFHVYVSAEIKRRDIYHKVQSLAEVGRDRLYELTLPGLAASDGSAVKTYLRRGNEKKLMVILNGGGVALDEQTARCPSTVKAALTGKPMLYTENMGDVACYGTFLHNRSLGILSAGKENPFSDWNLLFVHYASADFHVGANDFSYTDERGEQKILHCRGYEAFRRAIRLATELCPEPEQLLIGGWSAGAFGTSILAGEVMDLFPACSNITVYIDSAYVPYAGWKKAVTQVWKSPEFIADAVHSDDIAADWIEYTAKHYGARARLLYSGSPEDAIFSAYVSYFQTGRFKATPESIKQIRHGMQARQKRFEDSGVNMYFYYYDIPDPGKIGMQHCISNAESWTSYTENGCTPAQWLIDAVNGHRYNVGFELLKDRG